MNNQATCIEMIKKINELSYIVPVRIQIIAADQHSTIMLGTPN